VDAEPFIYNRAVLQGVVWYYGFVVLCVLIAVVFAKSAVPDIMPIIMASVSCRLTRPFPVQTMSPFPRCC
jgi:hypothetical protein